MDGYAKINIINRVWSPLDPKVETLTVYLLRPLREEKEKEIESIHAVSSVSIDSKTMIG